MSPVEITEAARRLRDRGGVRFTRNGTLYEVRAVEVRDPSERRLGVTLGDFELLATADRLDPPVESVEPAESGWPCRRFCVTPAVCSRIRRCGLGALG